MECKESGDVRQPCSMNLNWGAKPTRDATPKFEGASKSRVRAGLHQAQNLRGKKWGGYVKKTVALEWWLLLLDQAVPRYRKLLGSGIGSQEETMISIKGEKEGGRWTPHGQKFWTAGFDHHPGN